MAEEIKKEVQSEAVTFTISADLDKQCKLLQKEIQNIYQIELKTPEELIYFLLNYFNKK